MTSAAQLVGAGGGGAQGFVAAGLFGRASNREDERGLARLPGRGDPARGDAAAAPGLPGRDSVRASEVLPGREPRPEPGAAASASEVIRLPGQEGLSEGGPPRPLISGGAFTLAVAIGLSLDRQASPDGPGPATPANAGATAAGAEAAEEEGIDGLNEEEREQVAELQQRDAEVRRHEAAHAAAGGQYAGSPTFTYQTGPDGKRYAVGGEVSIDTAPVKGDPEATIRKAQQIRAAANAPADPSSQDRRVAAQADSLRQQAQAELTAQRREESQTEEAEAAEADAERAAREGDAGPAPVAAGQLAPAEPESAEPESAEPESAATGFAEEAPAGSTVAGDNAGTPSDREPGSRDGGFGPGDGGSVPDVDAEGPTQDTRQADRFAPSAFSGAAASYRGPDQTPRLVSIAV